MRIPTTGFTLAMLAASLFITAQAATDEWNGATEAKKIKCAGVNSCKGKGNCASGNNCKGSNSCKGRGYLRLTPEECEAAKEKIKQQGPFDF